MFLLSQTALNTSTDSLPDPTPVHLTERTGRLVWIDLLAFKRMKSEAIPNLELRLTLKDKIIQRLTENVQLAERKYQEEKAKNVLFVEQFEDVSKTAQTLNKKLSRSKKGGVVMGVTGVLIGLALGVLIAK